MRYLLLITSDETAEPYDPGQDNIEEWVSDLDSSGQRVFGSRLSAPKNATTVTKREGKVVVTDGPFAETKELILGFDVIETVSKDEAIAIAGRHPMARFGQVDVREFIE